MSSPTRDPEYLRIVDVARELKVTRRTVTGWCTSGKLARVKFGDTKQSKVRIAREELDRFLAANGGGR